MSTALRTLFVANLVLLAMLALSAPFVEPGTSTFVIALVSLGLIGVMLTVSVVFIYYDLDPFEPIFDAIGPEDLESSDPDNREKSDVRADSRTAASAGPTADSDGGGPSATDGDGANDGDDDFDDFDEWARADDP